MGARLVRLPELRPRMVGPHSKRSTGHAVDRGCLRVLIALQGEAVTPTDPLPATVSDPGRAAVEPPVVYWHRQLPPLDAEMIEVRVDHERMLPSAVSVARSADPTGCFAEVH